MQNAHELEALAEFLIAEKAEVFDMGIWQCRSSVASCGFAGCAIGHLELVYPETGLRMVPDRNRYYRPFTNGLVTDDFSVVAEYFGITESEAHYLFDELSYEDRYPFQKTVGERILTFIRSKENEVKNK